MICRLHSLVLSQMNWKLMPTQKPACRCLYIYNGIFWTVVLEKTLESPLDRKEIQPVHPEGNVLFSCLRYQYWGKDVLRSRIWEAENRLSPKSFEIKFCLWSCSFSISPSNEYLGLISFRIDWFDLLAVQGTLKSLLQHHSSKALSFLYSPTLTSIHDYWKNHSLY